MRWNDPVPGRNRLAEVTRADGRVEMGPEGFEPLGKPAAQGRRDLLAAFGPAIECRPPLDEGAVAVDDGGDAHAGAEVGHRQGRRAAELVDLRALDIGERQQPLADAPALVEHVPDAT